MSTAVVKGHYQDKTVAAEYDRRRFAGLTGRLFDAMEKSALRRALREVRRALPAPRTLDVPCGTGRITDLLLAEGLDVLGGDISEEMMDVARDKCRRFGDRAAFCRLDLDRLDVGDGSYDLVTCIRLFHHLDSPARKKVLAELARVSRCFVLVNVSLSTAFYRWRRRLKRLLGQGVSRQSSTWSQIRTEAAAAGLRLRRRVYVKRFCSEDVVLLLTKQPDPQPRLGGQGGMPIEAERHRTREMAEERPY